MLCALILSLAVAASVAVPAPQLPAPTSPAGPARVDAVMADGTVTLTEAGKTVLVYRTKSPDPANEPGRLNYIHPLYAPDGTVLTEDRPADHLHQRGVFWSWHQVLVNGKPVADGWFMKGLTFHIREQRFKGDAQGGGTLTINANWIVNSGPELDYVARETTRVRVYPLKDGGRRITFDTLITARAESLALGGSDDAKGYGGFSIRLIQPDRLTFASSGKAIAPADTAVDAGTSMGFAWSPPGKTPAWTVGLSCKANGQPVTRWILRQSLSMQNCVFPGRAPFVLKKDEILHLQETLVIRPATPVRSAPSRTAPARP